MYKNNASISFQKANLMVKHCVHDSTKKPGSDAINSDGSFFRHSLQIEGHQ
jgi:hypothetical protein